MLKNDILWYSRINHSLAEIGLQYITQGNDITPPPHITFFQREIDIFHQNSFAEINGENSKLRTYKLFKTSIQQEPYLTEIKNVKDRITMTKFRLSDHKIMIEKGRHHNIRKELRFCKFCPNTIEDEIHFLMSCTMFTTRRETLMTKIKEKINPFVFRNMSKNEKFNFLMEDISAAPLVAKYLTHTLELREFLLNEHKMHM